MFDILEIFDKEFTTYAIVISIVSILLLCFIFKNIFKHSNYFRVIFLSIIVYTFIAITGLAVYYVTENEYMFSTVDKYYFQGRVISINDEYIEVNITNSTLPNMNKGKVRFKLAKNTVYSIYSNSEDTRVEREKISSSSNVEIICKISEENNSEVTALKVTKVIY